MDKSTQFLNSITDAFMTASQLLGTKQPQRVGLGFALGLVIDALLKVLSNSTNLDFSYLNAYHSLATGILIVYTPLLIIYVFPTRRELYDERLDKIFAALRATFNDGDIDPVLRRQFYLKMANKIIDTLELDKPTKKELDFLKAIENQDLDDSETEY